MSKAYEVVKTFESEMANYVGSKYAVSVDSCTNAIFLCLKYLNVQKVTIPSRTYPSVPCSIIHAGGNVEFKNIDWNQQRYYQLDPYPIFDAAHCFKENMFKTIASKKTNAYVCISFSITKPINIGKGGMIFTNSFDAAKWFKQARYCGRHEKPLMKDTFEMLGWNMYMTPEQAARGLFLFKSNNFREGHIPEYPDLSKFKIYG